MKEFDEEYIKNIEHIVEMHDDVAAKKILEDLNPADIAELYQDHNLDQAE